MKKVLIDHKNLCFKLVEMDDVENQLYIKNNKGTNTVSNILTAMELQNLMGKGYKQID